jgi:hypothetical protein
MVDFVVRRSGKDLRPAPDFSCASVDGRTNNAKFVGMSASKTKSDLFQTITVQSSATVHHLSPTAFRIRKNGIEFKSDNEVGMWTEMTVELQLPGTKSFTCGGVVVACTGNRHLGYNVSLCFTSLTKQAQERLNDFSSIAAISVRV